MTAEKFNDPLNTTSKIEVNANETPEAYFNKLISLFEFSPEQQEKLRKNFSSEMSKGLNKEDSSLAMLPAFTDIPSGNEEGNYLAIDFGGTKLRVMNAQLNNGKIDVASINDIPNTEELVNSNDEILFQFIADATKKYIAENKLSASEKIPLGFTFSFPVDQTAIDEGTFRNWTKEIKISGMENKEVVGCLRDALKSAGVENVQVKALANDTVGTLARGVYTLSLIHI